MNKQIALMVLSLAVVLSGQYSNAGGLECKNKNKQASNGIFDKTSFVRATASQPKINNSKKVRAVK